VVAVQFVEQAQGLGRIADVDQRRDQADVGRDPLVLDHAAPPVAGPVAVQLLQRRAAPEPDRLAGQVARLVVLAGGTQPAGPRHELAEREVVDLGPVDDQPVGVIFADQFDLRQLPI
jgi:hypothetical protein